MFLSLLAYRIRNAIPSRNVLILDEAHKLEEEVVKFTGVSISKRYYKRYIADFKIPDYEFDLEKWIEFLNDLARIRLSSVEKDLLKRSFGYLPSKWQVFY